MDFLNNFDKRLESVILFLLLFFLNDGRPADVIIYRFSDNAEAKQIVKRADTGVSVSFYVKSPLSSYNLAMSSEQLEDAVRTNDAALEEALGYGLTVDDGPSVEVKEHLIEPWVTSLIVVAAVSILVAMFVAYVSHQNK